jgi:hypothetical protein
VSLADAVHLAQLAAAASLLAAARRAPSLRTASRVMALSLPLDALLMFGRDDGRALYHAAQAAQGAWLACVLAAAYAPSRAAVGLFVALLAAALYRWPAPATPLYAAAQAVTVAASIAALAAEYRRARAPLPGHLAAVVLVGSELACLVVPYLLAAYQGRPVAELWDAARVVRLLTWATLAVVGWRSWCSPGSWSLSSWRASARPSGPPGTPEPPRVQRGRCWPRGGQRGSGENGAASAGPG